MTMAVSEFEKGHGWHLQLERGIRMDATQRKQMSRKGGLVQSMVEKGGAMDWPQDSTLIPGGAATGASAILVTTTMTQRRESHCSSLEITQDAPRNNSITPSEVSLPLFLTDDTPRARTMNST